MVDRMRRTSSVWLLALAVLVGATLVTPLAHADAASEAFNDGKRLMGKGQFKEACAAFKRAEDAAGRNVKTRYWVGRCSEEQGKKAAAYLAYKDAKRMAEKAGDTDRLDIIDRRITELGQILPFLVITVPDKVKVAGLKIQRDDEDVPEAEWGKPQPVDIGKHLIKVSAPGHQEMTLHVTASEPGSEAQLVIPALTKATGTPSPSPRPTPAPTPTPKEPGEDEGPEMTRKSPGLFWTGVGLVAAGGVAAIAGGVLVIQGEADDEPLAGGRDRTPAGVALLITGGVFLGVGIPFMVVFGAKVPAAATTDGDDEKKDEDKKVEKGALLTVVPVITPGGFALHGTF